MGLTSHTLGSSTGGDFITERHLRNSAKVMLATGLIVAYGYMMETWTAWYSANTYEEFMMRNRFFGPYALFYWALIVCNVIVPQFLWVRRVRHSNLWLLAIAMFVNVGMWLERFVIIPISLHRDFLPSSWGFYRPTMFDFSMFFGTIGLFFFLMLLFLRFLPVISIFEMRTMVPGAQVKEEA